MKTKFRVIVDIEYPDELKEWSSAQCDSWIQRNKSLIQDGVASRIEANIGESFDVKVILIGAIQTHQDSLKLSDNLRIHVVRERANS